MTMHLSRSEVDSYVHRLWVTSTALRSLGWAGSQLKYDIDTAGIYIHIPSSELPAVTVVEKQIHPQSVGALVAGLHVFESSLPGMEDDYLKGLWAQYKGGETVKALREAHYTCPEA